MTCPGRPVFGVTCPSGHLSFGSFILWFACPLGHVSLAMALASLAVALASPTTYSTHTGYTGHTRHTGHAGHTGHTRRTHLGSSVLWTPVPGLRKHLQCLTRPLEGPPEAIERFLKKPLEGPLQELLSQGHISYRKCWGKIQPGLRITL